MMSEVAHQYSGGSSRKQPMLNLMLVCHLNFLRLQRLSRSSTALIRDPFGSCGSVMPIYLKRKGASPRRCCAAQHELWSHCAASEAELKSPRRHPRGAYWRRRSQPTQSARATSASAQSPSWPTPPAPAPQAEHPTAPIGWKSDSDTERAGFAALASSSRADARANRALFLVHPAGRHPRGCDLSVSTHPSRPRAGCKILRTPRSRAINCSQRCKNNLGTVA